MSRLFTDRKKPRWSTNTVALRAVIVAGLICISTSTVLAQQVETIKSAQPITCDGKSYQLRLIAAEALVNAKAAKALVIALTPNDTSASKVLGVYWLDAPTPLPTHRDNTKGTLGGNLITYRTGNDSQGVPIVQSFFADARCSSSDPQVNRIQTMFATQSLLDNDSASPITLKVIVDELNRRGVSSLNADQIQTASPQNLESFKNLPTDIAFAKAIREFVSISSGTVVGTNPVGTPLSREEEKRLLLANDQLRQQVQQLEAKKPSYLSAPLWLIIIFPITSVLSIGGIALLGLAAYHGVRKWNANRNSETHSSTLREENQPPVLPLITPPLTLVEKPPESKTEEPPPPPVEPISESLKPLVSDIGELRKSVESIDAKLKEHAVTQSLLQHLYKNDDVDGQREQLITDLQSFLDQLDEIRTTYFSTQLSEKATLNEIMTELKTKLDQDSNNVKEFNSIQESVSNYTGNTDNTSEAVTRLINEQSEAREKLKGYHFASDFSGTIDAVVNNYEELIRQVQQTLPDQQPPDQTATDEAPSGEALSGVALSEQTETDKGTMIKDLVTSTVAQYLTLKPKAERAEEIETENNELKQQLNSANSEVDAGKQLVDEIAAQLNFNAEHLKNAEAPLTAIVNRLKDERESSVHLQLRMGLSSALIALENAIKASGEHGDVVEAVYLEQIRDGIQVLLAEMEDCSGEELWHKALSGGFREKWLHYLIRADLLLRTYYADRREFSFLRTAVSLACSSILVALHELQVEVIEVRLLEERPKEMDTESVYPGLRNLQTVRERVRLKIMNTKTKELVVDVTSFPYFVKGVQENRGRAAIANTSAWVQN